jgi:hypothetical protein
MRLFFVSFRSPPHPPVAFGAGPLPLPEERGGKRRSVTSPWGEVEIAQRFRVRGWLRPIQFELSVPARAEASR